MRNGETAGKFNTAGLPGITGSVGAWIRMTKGTGAFYTPTARAANVSYEDFVTVEDNADQTSFDASRCNAEYGAQPTVMPASADMVYGIYLGSPA